MSPTPKSLQVGMKGIPVWLGAIVLIPTVLLELISGIGRWRGGAEWLATPFEQLLPAHPLLTWTAALLALVSGIFAWVRWFVVRRPEALALVCSLSMVALLDGAHSLSYWMPDPWAAMTWQLSRGLLSLVLLSGVGFLWQSLERPTPSRRGAWALALLVTTGSLWLVWRGDSSAAWHLLPLAAFGLGGMVLLPSVLTLQPTGLVQGLMVSTLPQVLCQLEMAFGSTAVGHGQRLLAYLAIFLGTIQDYLSSQQLGEDARVEREQAERKLESKTAELERIDLQRLWQEEKRRRAETQLRMLGKAVETMSLGVTITDMKGKIIYVNPADARAHGYDVEELIGSDARVFASGESAGPEVGDEEPWTRERLSRTKEGGTFPVRLVSDQVRNRDGQPIAMVTICEDIGERIRIRQALERRDRILEAVAVAAERFLAESTWEEDVEEVLGRLGEATGVDRVQLDLPQDPSPFGVEHLRYRWARGVDLRSELSGVLEQPGDLEIMPRWEAVLRSGESLHGPVSGFPPEEQRCMQTRGAHSFALVPIFVHTRWRGFLCLESDDHDRSWSHAELEALKTASRIFGVSIQKRQDEEALAASEAKYRDFLENANDLVQSVSPDGRFQFVNRAWRDALGYSPDEVENLMVWDIVRPVHGDNPRDVLQSMLVDDGLGPIEATFVSKTGREIPVEGIVTCRYVDGLPVAAQGIFRDITERKLIDRMKQEFISTVSHELRTPLTSIIASLALIESGRLDDQPRRINELVTVAHRNSQRLLKLINNLLDLQKLAARKMSFRSDSIDVGSLLEEAIRSIQAYADSCDVRLHLLAISEQMPRAVGDRDRLMQVLNNLISNAIKFSPADEVVTIGAAVRQDRVLLTVSDHGPGIPEEFQSRLFDQFTQADPSPTRSSGGSGLGLSIAKGLVEGMDGHISLETSKGTGTTFFVDLPAIAFAEAST